MRLDLWDRLNKRQQLRCDVVKIAALWHNFTALEKPLVDQTVFPGCTLASLLHRMMVNSVGNALEWVQDEGYLL